MERNLTLDERYAEGDSGRWAALAEELIALKPDVLAAVSDAVAVEMRRKTKTVPIVLIASANPVASGLVQSLARPGTNVTGNSLRFDDLTAKHFELLLEINPKTSRVGFFSFPMPAGDPLENIKLFMEQAARKAASAKGLQLVIVAADDARGTQKAFDYLQREGVQGLVVVPSGATSIIQDEIILGARRLRLPTLSALPARFAETGGLATYGPNYVEYFRYATKFVDLILKGGNPAEIPVEQITKIEFVLNLKTAREIGVTIPQTVLVRADRVIE